MLRHCALFSLFLIICSACKDYDKSHDPLTQIISRMPLELSSIIDSSVHEIQILYTQIDRDEQNTPHLTSYTLNFNKQHYFYPASTVKMPVAFLALQRINELNRTDDRINMLSRMQIDSIRPPQTAVELDSATKNNYPNVATYIKKIFSVSDNDAYNRLYEFLGQDYINEELKNKGIFSNSRIRTRVGISGFTTEDNKYTNPISFIDDSGVKIFEQDEYYALYSYYEKLENDTKGIGYFSDSLESVVMTPFDMSEKNFINIKDLEASLRRIVFPELYDENELFDISPDHYEFLYEIMPKTPLEFDFNKDHSDEYFDSYVKFFYNGDSKLPIPDHIRIFNKVGWAYGTLTDCSYIIDLENNIEFFLTATIHVNDNRIFNDGNYEYEEIGLPFLSELGKACYNFELERNRKFKPDLQKFKI